jgi:methylglutaconyl-CoA hydratase
MDLSEMLEARDIADPKNRWIEDAEQFRDLLLTIHELPKPSLAAVGGPALGGGAGIVLACDLAIASEKATIGLPEARRGIVAALVAPFLVMRAGVGAARYALLTGENLSASEAHRLGIFHKVVPHGDLEKRTDEIAASVAANAPGALATTKRVLAEIAADRLAALLEQGIPVSAEARGTEEAAEGLRAFLEKRPPRWASGGGS